jgi:hypothetical protein
MENKETTPSKETMLAWMKEQIEFKTIQLELQELNTKIAVGRMEEAKAVYTLAQITTPPSSQEHDEHILTEEDIKANPELAEQGLKVGDVIGIPKIKTNIKDNGTSKSS